MIAAAATAVTAKPLASVAPPQNHSVPQRTAATAAGRRTQQLEAGDKIIHLVRHGQTFMNVHLGRLPPGQQYGQPGFRDPQIPDTRLTPAGWAQASAGRLRVAQLAPPPELVVVSPLTRALQTADAMFFGVNCPRLALPLAAERLYLSSDVGRPREQLEAEFPRVCFGELPLSSGSSSASSSDGSDSDSGSDGTWWHLEGSEDEEEVRWAEALLAEAKEHPINLEDAREPSAAFLRRIERLRQWLAARPERSLALVCHWGTLFALTGENFRNCEVRTVTLSALQARPHLLRPRSSRATQPSA